MAATAQQFQTTLSFRLTGAAPEALRAISRSTGGRCDVRVHDAAGLELAAESLL